MPVTGILERDPLATRRAAEADSPTADHSDALVGTVPGKAQVLVRRFAQIDADYRAPRGWKPPARHSCSAAVMRGMPSFVLTS